MIEIRQLKKSYSTYTPLTDISADIREGDVIAVIGPSGAGKSTFLRCINLLERPTSGSIRIDGEDILDPRCDVSRIRRKAGMIFQSFNLFGHLTVIENIMRPQMDVLGRSPQEAYDRGMELLRRVGLAKDALKYPDEESGGQKQRIAIARALAMDPEIFLFDEPTSSLDPRTVGEVQAVIRDLAEAGKTMMIVTHDLAFARSIANRVFYLDNGVIYEEGTPEEIFDNPRKELTRRFIHKLVTLEILVDGPDFDFLGAYGQIAEYCGRNRIPHRAALRIQLVFEELIQQILLPELADPTIRFTVNYSEENECAEIVAAYKGRPFNTDDVKNDLSMTLLKNAVSVMEHRTDPDDVLHNHIRLVILSRK